MTVKNYVLDINKKSLQHPSIVLRQDDYNIYTVNISVTDNGTPVDLGPYTLNFLGITPAGAKIIDSENFITNSGDLAVGKFSYRFPKEAAGSKGVYDVAYFRLKTTSGATSTIDLNLRVLGGIDLTADEAKDYITVDDTLRNTLVAEVFKKVDAKVDEHLATVKKGDKGDTGPTGPAGKDGYMPIIGGRNLLTKTDYFITEDGDRVKHSLTVKTADLVGRTITISFKADIDEVTSVSGDARFIMAFTSHDSDGTSTYNPAIKSMNVGDSYHGVIQRTLSVPNEAVDYYIALSIQGVSGKNMQIGRPKLEAGNVPTDWTPAPEDKADDANVVHNTGKETIAGTKEFSSRIKAKSLISTLPYNITTFKEIATHMTDYGGTTWSTNFSLLTDRPNGMPPNWGILTILDSYPNSSAGQLIAFSNTPSSFNAYIGSVSNGTIGWYKLASDNTVVHNTGNETIAGNKTLTGLTTMLTGNYGLRVTSSGFQKTTDGGKTWVTATL